MESVCCNLEVFPILFPGEDKAFINNTLVMERVTEATKDGVLLGQVVTLGRLEIDTIIVANSTEQAQQIFDMVITSSWAREVTEAPARHPSCFRMTRLFKAYSSGDLSWFWLGR